MKRLRVRSWWRTRRASRHAARTIDTEWADAFGDNGVWP